MSDRFTHFDGMCWPVPSCLGVDGDPISWRFRYNTDVLCQMGFLVSDLLYVASIIDAYEELIRCPRVKRDKVVREIKKAMKEE